MKEIIELKVKEAFKQLGYDETYGMISWSKQNIGDLQCSGAMAAAKKYQQSPMAIAEKVVSLLKHQLDIQISKPGFINITLTDDMLKEAFGHLLSSEKYGLSLPDKKKIIVDYGGANIAKPLHVGHLRSAIIGDSLKRIYQYFGHDVIGDIHLGDWGLQMGLVIEELKQTQPDLVYFDEGYNGEYPSEAPFDVNGLSEIYPTASAKSKAQPTYLEAARKNTMLLQKGHKGYTALWQHICRVSIDDLEKNYGALNVFFELWNGESHTMNAIDHVVALLNNKRLLEKDDGAYIVRIEEEDDKKPMPPFIALKSDGAALYHTTDLTTIYQRVQDKALDEIVYLTDKRQTLHFEQVFRVAKASSIVREDMPLKYIGFGTMNGKDGKPFKTRDGGVMKLEDLIEMLRRGVQSKLHHSKSVYSKQEKDEIAMTVGLAALKFGDLQNAPVKDYVFDLDKFANFEGKTGPYILYSIVRIHSILKKVKTYNKVWVGPTSETERQLMIKLMQFKEALYLAYSKDAPNKICDYIYDLSNIFNRFYHETNILKEETRIKSSHLTLIEYIMDVLTCSLDLLGIKSLNKM